MLPDISSLRQVYDVFLDICFQPQIAYMVFDLELSSLKTYIKFLLAPMGVLAPGSAHARPPARPPIDTSGNFSAHMSGGGEIV